MDKTKAKIIELCPDVMERRECDCQWCAQRQHNGGGGHYITGSPITLSVVLRAIRKVFVTVGHDFSLYEKAILGLVGQWSEQVNYDEQSQETKDFINSLLGV